MCSLGWSIGRSVDRSIVRSVDRARRPEASRILAVLCSLGWRRSLWATLVPVEDQVQSGVLNRIDRSIGRSVDRSIGQAVDRSIGRSVDRARRPEASRILAWLCSLGWRRSLRAALVPGEDQVQSGVLNRSDWSIGRSVDLSIGRSCGSLCSLGWRMSL